MKIIGLTGGIASGKSTVADILIENGYKVIDCDKIAWALAEPQREIWQIYLERYGERVLNPDRTLNRQAVADIVFRDKEELTAINALVHPIIKGQMWEEAAQAKKSGVQTIFFDVPLLFEAGFDKMTDENWLVYVLPEIQKERLMARNGYSEAEALRRISAQMSLEKKKLLADVVIDNNGDVEELHRQVLEQVKDGQG
ncbi:dephospho-CoA kinase [uncultured Anaerovibrio sp.]|uniref:dephospho-CoA kinase n=1 Tax=uncultured Anaerovibrio sp. TaxID=361586 RepID=UPI0026150094|nr:dephospho-CoA kinase [uncultured Anaerovibrio sp.]